MAGRSDVYDGELIADVGDIEGIDEIGIFHEFAVVLVLVVEVGPGVHHSIFGGEG